jgi:demethylmenaquinone methyltransferase / 2-methoxy-6-polyprenyl-1,4-benzoquinol methylase
VSQNSTNAAEFDARTDNVFTRIAGRYDKLCDIFSLFAHRSWKSTMARQIARGRWLTLLDVASGTGDIALRVAARPGMEGRAIIASDICPGMLAVAKLKAAANAKTPVFRILDAHRLDEIEDESIDCYAISFGMKICDRPKVLQQAFRVLKPGGLFHCLEASRIPTSFIHSAYLKYMDWCLPLIARIATDGDRGAYDYLLRGIHDFPGAPELAKEISAFGFREVSYRCLTFGIVALHVAQKPIN